WRQVIDHIVNINLTLAMSNLAFRGHRGIIGEGNIGNFLSIVELLAKYDPLLEELIRKPKGLTMYLSPKIQNKIIQLLSDQVTESIVNDIKNTPFYSVILDTTQDLSKVNQLSQVFQYVTIEKDEKGNPAKININESLLGFHEVSGQSGTNLEGDIKCIKDKGLELSKLRGQGYDGAANMSRMYSGVQVRIAEKELNTRYVHCAAHNLNLVLNDSVRTVTELQNFYGLVETLFGHSINQWALLSSFVSKFGLTLKRLCPKCWSSHYDSLVALRYRYRDILKALSQIILKTNKPEDSSLHKHLESFNVILMIVFQTKVLETINVVSKMLQSETQELGKAAEMLENAYNLMKDLRNSFSNIRQLAVKVA
uniref:DUF4371 domain-containing protein n=1 Tax=Latimeria chalumnae TaxID=7897 RepID=H3A841_LATCH